MATPTNSAVPAEGRPERSSTVSTDGTSIGWISKGRGQPLLMVHGGGADHTRLEPSRTSSPTGSPSTLWIGEAEA
jgi:hypothetical protein